MWRKIGKTCVIALCVAVGAFALWFGGIIYESCVDYLHGDVTWYEEDGVRHLQYGGSTYYQAEPALLFVSYDAPETELAWHYNLPFTSTLSYCAPDATQPPYISNGLDVYLREDRDFMDNAFCIEGSAEPFLLSDVLTEVQQPIPWDRETQNEWVRLYMRDIPYVLISEPISRIDGQWYLRLGKRGWLMSETLIEALIQAGVIQQQ